MSRRWQDALDGLDGATGRGFWRSLDELGASPTFQAALLDEFPALATLDWTRRGVLRAFGASLALAGLTGCEARPDRAALPYVEDPEHLVPGRPLTYASGVPFAGIVQPVLGVTTAGRPTKLEGNPDHPASRGATDAFTQAALLDLYDPERSRAPLHRGEPTSWSGLDAALAGQAARLDARRGAGFRLLTGATTSPTLQRQMDALLARWPEARWHVFEPIDDAELHQATRLAFGRALDVTPLLDRAEAVIAFDADPLGAGPCQLRNSLAWAIRRRAFQAGDGQAALLVAEPSPSLTGGRSLDRLVAEPSRIPPLVAALASVFGIGASPALTRGEREWIERAARQLAAVKGRGLVLVGDDQPAATQALGWAIDERLGNLARTSRLTEPLRPSPAPDRTLAALRAALDAGEVDALAIIDCNPVYTAPGGVGLARAIGRARYSLHAGLWADETAAACQWHAPLAHPLESWSDGRAADGSAVISQPLVQPFTDTRPLHRIVAAIGGDFAASDLAVVQQCWSERWGALQPRWDEALLKGVVAEPPPPAIAVSVILPPPPGPPPATPSGELELLVRPDPTVWDGRLANNPWAQELPKPMTTLTWDNAVLIAPALAAREGIEDGDEVRLDSGGAVVVGAAWVVPGQAPRTVLIHRGYGRRFGEVARGAGFDVMPLVGRRLVTLTKTGAKRSLAAAQTEQAIDGTGLVRVVDRIDASAASSPAAPSFWAPKTPTRPNWGMAIDLDLCTGCGACVTACNAENNIPMVGREEVARGRRMHWLRIDRYYEGSPAAPTLHVQPVPCMHCEDAPCEMGCPVNATVHSPEGLNVQVYNRCIGTRTCASYCPYKVRRFNWHDYTGDAAEPTKAQRNPNVTVRARGVMEKCTYCIQRISAARIDAKLGEHAIADGTVKTACQQVCPTGAISFGDIADPAATVVSHKGGARDYSLLEDRNTRPRTTYRARIRSERRDG